MSKLKSKEEQLIVEDERNDEDERE